MKVKWYALNLEEAAKQLDIRAASWQILLTAIQHHEITPLKLKTIRIGFQI